MSDELIIFTIYDHPADYPNHFVVRKYQVKATGPRPDRHCWLVGTLEEARKHIPEGLTRCPRQPGDDPVIVECWM